LYDGLSSHDRHLRFFSAYHPPREFLASWAGIAERGGCCLVAVRSAPGGPGSVVADAGYLALPNGNGELAVTVARGERGGLGGVLVDALLDAAATRGVAALEAEVLLENEAMLRLVRARGAREVGRDGSYSVRMSLPSRPGVRESAARRPGRHSLDVRSASGRGASPVLRIG
jgi:RimJ/RimL family protein N-acetyltransferase